MAKVTVKKTAASAKDIVADLLGTAPSKKTVAKVAPKAAVKKAVAKVAPKAIAKKVAPKTATKRGSRSPFTADMKITILKDRPVRGESDDGKSFKMLKTGMTIGQWQSKRVAAKITAGAGLLAYLVRAKYIKVTAPK